MMPAVYESNLTSLKQIYRGKVRDIYEVNAEVMLMVTTDRMSAFDVILPTPVAGKGVVLTQVSNFWFEKMRPWIKNHLTQEVDLKQWLTPEEYARVKDRSMLVRKLKPIPVEAIVRGYLVGSGWKEYQASGQVCGIALPEGLQQASALPEPIFTPSTKAEVGDHDINISFEDTVKLIGADLAHQVKEASLRIYKEAADYAKQRGILIADTKFEFGLDDQGELVLMDEALTPDSSRFWDANTYAVGSNPPSYDKQIIRDYLESLSDWNKTAPGPQLPADIVQKTIARYEEVQRLLTQP
jgi:phosphoribosylaminoimidazole-succinocarboxamide synthase